MTGKLFIFQNAANMKRIQLFEFEDMKNLPSWIRASVTDLIVVLNKMMGIDKVLAELIRKQLKLQQLNTVVDLGSGSGGVMPLVHRELSNEDAIGKVALIMTDLYPNKEAIDQFSQMEDNISYFSRPVNATELSYTPQGLKTMVNCFHHMPVPTARDILKSAQENKQPLLIYEMSDNKIPTLAWWLFLPVSLVIMVLMVVFMTPFVRPFTFRRFIFTYLIPVIPLVYAWDGQASMPRTYSLSDYDELLLDLPEVADYRWEKDYALDAKGKKNGTFLIGRPA